MPTSTNIFTIRATPDAAVACDMTGASDTPEERVAEYGRLFAHALVARGRTRDGVVFTFATKPGVADWIVDLVRRESACCPFFAYTVEGRGAQIVWTTSTDVGPVGQAILDEFFAGPDRFDDGFAGLIARLAERDVNVVTDGPARFVLDESADDPCSARGTAAAETS